MPDPITSRWLKGAGKVTMVHNIWVIIELSFLDSILLRKGIHF